jgi:hypothetical protein
MQVTYYSLTGGVYQQDDKQEGGMTLARLSSTDLLGKEHLDYIAKKPYRHIELYGDGAEVMRRYRICGRNPPRSERQAGTL